MTSEKLKPTPGPWKPIFGGESQSIEVWAGLERVACTSLSKAISRAKQITNARLIAEAGTVFHECGLSLWELLEGYRELRKTLQDLEASYQFLKPAGHSDSDSQKSARAALATYKEV